MTKILALPGDGIGPEIMAAARRVLGEIGDFEIDERLVGGASIDEHGTALTEKVLDACRASDAVLLAAVGGPKWDSTDPDAPRPEQGLLALRKELELFANLRPVRPSPALLDASPLRRDRIEGTDLLVHDDEYDALLEGVEVRLGRWHAWVDGEPGEDSLTWLAQHGSPALPPRPSQEARLTILTSGTTGTPSYIPLTRQDLDNWVTASARSYSASGIVAGETIVSTYNAGPFVAGAALAAFDRFETRRFG